MSLRSHHSSVEVSTPPLTEIETGVEVEVERLPLSIILALFGKGCWLQMIPQVRTPRYSLLPYPKHLFRCTCLGNNMMGSHAVEADTFFFHRQHPLPSPLSAPTQATIRSTQTVQQHDGQQSKLNTPSNFAIPPHEGGVGAFRMPLHQTASHPLSVPASPIQCKEFFHFQQAEQEDTEMEDAHYPLAAGPNLATANHLKGLSSSKWNPANEHLWTEAADNNQASLAPHSRTSSSAGEVAIVTSGLMKGPGLKASR
ncbi:hypothetical protein NUW58_g7490 [Xylaria curta]|uniref:Uncharacterized protein n=1 Tax=Xylaria curta TaxID=42375 RepID=A0ACC1NGJ3_9PEZI|nr:hypothetical protein NUW58_g7490 [Xylaria curta]